MKTLFKNFLYFISLYVYVSICDEIIIMGYSKHEYSTRNMLYSLNNLFILHPYLPISATSPQWLLSSVPKVAFMERFDCIYCYSLDPQVLLFC